MTNVNESCELKILDELPKTDKKQVEETLNDDIVNDEINSIDAYFEDLEKKNQVYQRASSRKVESEDPQIEPKVNKPLKNYLPKQTSAPYTMILPRNWFCLINFWPVLASKTAKWTMFFHFLRKCVNH